MQAYLKKYIDVPKKNKTKSAKKSSLIVDEDVHTEKKEKKEVTPTVPDLWMELPTPEGEEDEPVVVSASELPIDYVYGDVAVPENSQAGKITTGRKHAANERLPLPAGKKSVSKKPSLVDADGDMSPPRAGQKAPVAVDADGDLSPPRPGPGRAEDDLSPSRIARGHAENTTDAQRIASPAPAPMPTRGPDLGAPPRPADATPSIQASPVRTPLRYDAPARLHEWHPVFNYVAATEVVIWRTDSGGLAQAGKEEPAAEDTDKLMGKGAKTVLRDKAGLYHIVSVSIARFLYSCVRLYTPKVPTRWEYSGVEGELGGVKE